VFPGPRSAVLDPDLRKDGPTGDNIMYLLRGLGTADCPLLFPLPVFSSPWLLALVEQLGKHVVGELEPELIALLLNVFGLQSLRIHEGFERVPPTPAGTSTMTPAGTSTMGLELETSESGSFSLLLVLIIII